jgi:hypothetical protein
MQHLEAVSHLEGPHCNAGMATMAKYVQYLFNLQHNTARTVMQQHMRLTTYDEHNTAFSREHEQLKHENAFLYNGTLPPSDQDREFKVTYHRLSKAEHGSNYACQQLDSAHDEVDTHTHMIIHFKHAMEHQDHKLKERIVTIATLVQQL